MKDEALLTHNCPGPTPQGTSCIKYTATTQIDIAKLWGETGCPLDFTFEYRICTPGTVNFEIIESPLTTLAGTFSSDLCADKYIAEITKIWSDPTGLKSEAFELELGTLISEAAVNTVALQLFGAISNPKDFECGKGAKLLTGRYYYGACSATCHGYSIDSKPGSEIKVISLYRKKAYCGGTCCYATSDFCTVKNALGNYDVRKSQTVFNNWANACSEPVEDVSICPDIPKVTWVWHKYSKCVSACGQKFPDYKIVKEGSLDDNKFNVGVLTAETIYNSNNKLITVKPLKVFIGTISLVDLQGRVIEQKSYNRNDSFIEFETDNMASGVYLISLQNTNTKEMYTDKIIID